MGRRDAIVNVRAHDGKVGTLWCRDGEIIDAACDGFTGEDAVIRALAWQGGKVSVEFESISRQRLIQTGTSGLLLRAAYIHDVQEQEDEQPFEAPLGLGDDDDATTVEPPHKAQHKAQYEPQQEPALDIRRPLDWRFVTAGGLSVLLLFGALAWRWMDAPPPPSDDARRLGLPEPLPPEHATTSATTATTATTTAVKADPVVTTHAASIVRPANAAPAKSITPKGAATRRHATATTKRTSQAPSTLAATNLGEGKKASASRSAKVEIIRESPPPETQPRIQVIEERQPRVQVIEDPASHLGEPRAREPHVDEIR